MTRAGVLCLLMVVACAGNANGEDFMKHRLTRVVEAAVSEAERCEVAVDEVEMTVRIQGATYQVEFYDPSRRGGGAVVTIDRETQKVRNTTCLQ